MNVGIPKESFPGERRVAATPDSVARLKALGFNVVVEETAGLAAGFADDAFVEAGATIAGPDAVWSSPIIAKIRPPNDAERLRLQSGQTLISYFYPAQQEPLIATLQSRGTNVIAMDQVPRTTRAQKVDALSSMGNLAGYRAVVEAAAVLQRPMGGQTTAAGKIPPCMVLVIGAGVAGLAAIGAARALGAIVRAFDTRPAAREQVASMGAEFLEVSLDEDGTGVGGYARTMSPEFIAAEMALFAEQAKDVDVIITTALIPGKTAPVLLDAALVASMRRGSVIVDLAAEMGGNCAETEPGHAVDVRGVTVIGYTDMPSRMSLQASTLYANNIVNLLEEMGGAADYAIDEQNDIVRPMTVLKDGALLWPPPPAPQTQAPGEAAAKPAGAPAAAKPSAGSASPKPGAGLASPAAKAKTKAKAGHQGPPVGPPSNSAWVVLGLAGLALVGLGTVAPETFLTHLTVFVLACFIGYHVVWSVSAALHTPLMSVTNAISGIIVLGGMLQIGGGAGSAAELLGLAAIFVAMINVSGGFLVTHRMLKMFRR
jgi:NAD(P) transhydrogenase subunit alpha